MTWFWLNMLPAAVFILATAGTPLWMMLRHPDTGPAGTGSAGSVPAGSGASAADATPQSQPVIVPVTAAVPARRKLAGAPGASGA